jgi:CheY-like chemotaxis protein
MLRGPEHAKPDLMLLNLNLPKRTGFEVLEEMKENGLAESIPAVVFSSSSLDADKARCLALGAKSFHTKPCTYDDYMTHVQSFCRMLG